MSSSLREHDRVVLTDERVGSELCPGDVGTIVHVYDNGEAFEVEFCSLSGETVTVETLSRDSIRPVGHRDLTHARPMNAS